MNLPREADQLKIYVGGSDKHGSRPLYEVIVREARDRGLAGANVIRGIMGYGTHGEIHSAKILRMAEDLPVVIEIIDSAEKIDAFLPFLDEVLEEGLVLREKANIIAYRRSKED